MHVYSFISPRKGKHKLGKVSMGANTLSLGYIYTKIDKQEV